MAANMAVRSMYNKDAKRKADGRSFDSEWLQNKPATSTPIMHRTPDKNLGHTKHQLPTLAQLTPRFVRSAR